MNKIVYRDLSCFKYQLWTAFIIETPIRPDGDLPIASDFFRLELDGTLKVNSGYAWDGPSGPTIDTKVNMRASLPHDVFYQMMRMGLLSPHKKDQVDHFLKTLLLEDGMSEIEAEAWYLAVSVFGRFHMGRDPNDVLTIHEAP